MNRMQREEKEAIYVFFFFFFSSRSKRHQVGLMKHMHEAESNIYIYVKRKTEVIEQQINVNMRNMSWSHEMRREKCWIVSNTLFKKRKMDFLRQESQAAAITQRLSKSSLVAVICSYVLFFSSRSPQ